MEEKRHIPPTAAEPPAAPNADADASPDTRRPAQLRVPTTGSPPSWWDPTFWPAARPTDFCYGDCVRGLEFQPVPLTISEWTELLWRREELEYDLPTDREKYVASS